LIFFSKELEGLIRKVWGKGLCAWKKAEKRPKESRKPGKGDGAQWSPRIRRQKREEDFLEGYESSPMVRCWELGEEWRGDPWQRVKRYFREMSAYEEVKENGCNAKYVERILKEI